MITQAIGLALVGTAGIHGAKQPPKMQNETIINRTLLATRNEILGYTTITSPVGLWLTNRPLLSSVGLVIVPNNVTLKVTAQQNGWYKVSYNRQTGWIDGQYTSGLSSVGSRQSIPTKNTKNNSDSPSKGQLQIESPVGLYMAAGPNTESNLGVAVPYKTKLIFTAEKNGWYRVSYSGEVGWVDGQYITVINNKGEKPKSTNLTISINSPVGLWMTNGPRRDSRGIVCLPYNTILNAINKENGWYEVTYDGGTGWVDGQYVNIINNNNSNTNKVSKIKDSKPISLGNSIVKIKSPVGLWMNCGPGAYTGQLRCISYNTSVKVINQKNGWYEIDYQGCIGWIDSQYTTKVNGTIEKQDITVTSPSGLWMGSAPYGDIRKITCLPYNTKAAILGQYGSWFKVQYAGYIGWIDGAYATVS